MAKARIAARTGRCRHLRSATLWACNDVRHLGIADENCASNRCRDAVLVAAAPSPASETATDSRAELGKWLHPPASRPGPDLLGRGQVVRG